MKVIVLGKTGQLSRCLQQVITRLNTNFNFQFVARDELDLDCDANIELYLNKKKYDVLINCAAYTYVDKSEENKVLANQINNLALKKISSITQTKKAKLIHISTDYVFDGNSSDLYTENDKTNPLNVYGNTKLDGEKTILQNMPTDSIIIRTSWVYSEYGNNFVKNILKLAKENSEINMISDQIGSPTYAVDLANCILEIIDNDLFQKSEKKSEIFHYSNDGEISWYDFAKEVVKLAKLECKVNPIQTKEYPTLAQRPMNSSMSKDKISQEYNLPIIFWKNSLKKCIAKLI